MSARAAALASRIPDVMKIALVTGGYDSFTENMLDFLLDRLSPPKRDLFIRFVTEAISETVKIAIVATASVASPIAGPIVGQVGGEVSKEFIGTLLKRTSEIEKKLDKRLFEPFQTGIQLLFEAQKHSGSTPRELASRDALLHTSHVSFVRAHSLIVNSREDSVFVRSLDCLALTWHTGRETVARETLAQVEMDIHLLQQNVEALETKATEWTDDVTALNKFLGREDYGAKPFGYSDQVAFAKRYEKKAKRSEVEAQEARRRLSILDGIVAVARRTVDGPSQQSFSA